MESNGNSREISKLVEKSKRTNAGLGGYIVYMVILLGVLIVDTIYYETHVWYDVDYDIYTGLLQMVIFLYATIYLFNGTEGHRIIYGWKRWTLGFLFALWTMLSAYGAWTSLNQTGEEIHSKTGYTRTEWQELKQNYLDAGYTEKDFVANIIDESSTSAMYERIYGLLYIASCIGLWKWSVSVKAVEKQKQENDENNTEE